MISEQHRQMTKLSQEFRELQQQAATLALHIYPEAPHEQIREAITKRKALTTRRHLIRKQLEAMGYVYDGLAEGWRKAS